MKIPDLDIIKSYEDREDVQELMSILFNLPWIDAPTGCWMIVTLFALLEEAKRTDKYARVIMNLPEGDGYEVWDICPEEGSVFRRTIPSLPDQTEMPWWASEAVMSEKLNSLIYISKWVNCEEHEEKAKKPNLTLAYDSENVEDEDINFAESISILDSLSAYKKNPTIS